MERQRRLVWNPRNKLQWTLYYLTHGLLIASVVASLWLAMAIAHIQMYP